MAVLDLDLGDGGTTTVDSENASDGDVLNITALASSTLIVDGVDVSIGEIAGVSVGADPDLVVRNGASLLLDQGLLNISALTGLDFRIEDRSQITLDGSALDLASGVTNLLNSHEVDFSGSDNGRFVYDTPALSVLGGINFDVTGMETGDEFDLDGQSWSLDTTPFGGPTSAYRNGALQLESGLGLVTQRVTASIQMTQDEANLFFADQAQYLSGDDFTFPGVMVCVCRGTPVLTATGYRPVESLKAGDMLQTLSGELKRILWADSSRLDPASLDLLPNMRPIRIRANALGAGYPSSDLELSPQHRIYVNGRGIEATAGVGTGLIAAKHLVGLPGVEVVGDAETVDYFHILLPDHDVIWTAGLPTESMYIGPYTAARLNPSHRRALQALYPDFATRFRNGAETPFSLLKGKVARQILRKRADPADFFDATRLETRDRTAAQAESFV